MQFRKWVTVLCDKVFIFVSQTALQAMNIRIELISIYAPADK